MQVRIIIILVPGDECRIAGVFAKHERSGEEQVRPEHFFHRSSVQGSFDQLNEGQRVAFDEEPSAKGPRAGNVRGEG